MMANLKMGGGGDDEAIDNVKSTECGGARPSFSRRLVCQLNKGECGQICVCSSHGHFCLLFRRKHLLRIGHDVTKKDAE
jgi:hypothetical protein